VKKIKAVIELCGDEEGFVGILNSPFIETAEKLVRNKFEKIIMDTRLLLRGIYKGKQISYYPNGKIVVKGLKDKKEAEILLEEILS